jgi:cytochrome c oxidase subunit 2
MLACLGMFIVAPMVGWWLPPGVSTHSWDVDKLFYIILYITGFFFILTEAILVVFMFKYAGRPASAPKTTTEYAGPNVFQKMFPFLNSQHRVEMTWTAVPAIILLYIAFAQVGTWLEIKDRSMKPSQGKNTQGNKGVPIQIEVSARQFEWRVRYPSSKRLADWLDKKDTEGFQSFGKFRYSRPLYPHQDDVKLVNEVHLWKEQTILVQLNTLDVIHSFNIPHMRVKQDALPGKTIPVWFTPIKSNTRYNAKTDRWEDAVNEKGEHDLHYRWEIACAELCGWGHHRMIARVYVHENREDFFKWLKHVEKDQNPPVKEKLIAAR